MTLYIVTEIHGKRHYRRDLRYLGRPRHGPRVTASLPDYGGASLPDVALSMWINSNIQTTERFQYDKFS